MDHVAVGDLLGLFTPGALECDVIRPKYPDFNANNFWRDGGATVSQIHRAKGNEAEMVHVVGFDLVAKDEGASTCATGSSWRWIVLSL